MAVNINLMSKKKDFAIFKRTIWAHYRRAGRTALPWRRTRDPYAILVSEIMLQQTQVGRVEGYYKKFLDRFPDFRALARARNGDMLKVWQGLGYNRRAMFLKRTAEVVLEQYGGRLPRDRAALRLLPGIGKGTSGALMAFAFNKPEVFIETNIRRVFIHFFFPKRRGVTDVELERYIESSIDKKNPREWYWALMDYGAAMKAANSNRRSAHYKKQAPFTGSDRELRGKVLRLALAAEKNKIGITKLLGYLPVSPLRLEKIITGLEKEGFIVRKGNYICIK
jgi:A/G-specific adenine glycosylase